MRKFSWKVPVAAVIAGALIWAGYSISTAAHVAAGFTAKLACSLVRNSGQPIASVLDDYIARELAPAGGILSARVDTDGAEATAFGVVRAFARHRPGLGCTLVPNKGASLAKVELRDPLPPLPDNLPWPEGEGPASTVPGETAARIASAIDAAFAEPGDGAVRRTTAVVIAHRGRLLAERYAEGYLPSTPMLSWSMAKSVIATVVGVLVGDGKLHPDEAAPVPEWEGDLRAAITLDDLLRMSSGLQFDEHYGAVNDVSRMLFANYDTGGYAAASEAPSLPGGVWSYSSGTTNIVSRIVRDQFGGDTAALIEFVRTRLFEPAGLRSAFFEFDTAGTPIGSSFVFMTARDWARFAELHRRGGRVGETRILPEGWVEYVTRPSPAAPEGKYGAHWWLNAGDPKDPSKRMWPTLPPDAYAARGHNGQYAVVVPSKELVVVRLGLSTGEEETHGLEELVANTIAALP